MSDTDIEPSSTPARADLYGLLVQQGHLDEATAEHLRKRQRRGRLTPLQAVLDQSEISQEVVYRALAQDQGLELVSLTHYDFDPKLFDGSVLPIKVILHYRVVPLKLEKSVLTAAFPEPPAARDIQQLRLLTGLRVQPVLATRASIERTIKERCGLGADTLLEIRKDTNFQRRVDSITVDSISEDLDEEGDGASVTHLFKQFLLEALSMQATDIHIEPFEEYVQVRYRIDGMLRVIPTPPSLRQLHSSVVARAKVLANLNIAEHRLPHDGRIRCTLDGQQFDLRVSIMPTRFGETLNLRILNRASVFLDLVELGLSERNLRIMLKLLELPHGMILVTGPTGSGKSTTLYAALDKADKVQRKVITVEDPVEYQMEGISQIQMHSAIGLTFARGLRSILRHDPDVILVGEIRDSETAEIAIRAALTGHLVLSTLHTNDSVGAVNRLIDMDVEPFLVASSLSGVIAQRLVRRICPHCKEEMDPDLVPDRTRLEIVNILQINDEDFKVWHGKGCDECSFTGYRGRLAVHEFFLMNEYLQDMVSRGSTTVELRDRAMQDGMVGLREDGWLKVGEGKTTIEEILRVTTSYDVRY